MKTSVHSTVKCCNCLESLTKNNTIYVVSLAVIIIRWFGESQGSPSFNAHHLLSHLYCKHGFLSLQCSKCQVNVLPIAFSSKSSNFDLPIIPLIQYIQILIGHFDFDRLLGIVLLFF